MAKCKNECPVYKTYGCCHECDRDMCEARCYVDIRKCNGEVVEPDKEVQHESD